ncbi:hypothetical protein [Mycolicibacterium wolinskyi]|uniref:hypothetical protein n=1 Tax=Mycolicibacterium wolinskyi TaxID=59750 RepID=UPI003BACB421
MEIAGLEHREPTEVAQLYYTLSTHLGIDHLLTAISALEDADRWDGLVKSTLRQAVYDAMRSLCRDTVSLTAEREPVTTQSQSGERTNRSRLAGSRAIAIGIIDRGIYDVKTLTVATRQLRTMISKDRYRRHHDQPATRCCDALSPRPSRPPIQLLLWSLLPSIAVE